MARPEGFEPPTLCLEGRCSIRLSYGRYLPNFSYYNRLCYSPLFLLVLDITIFDTLSCFLLATLPWHF